MSDLARNKSDNSSLGGYQFVMDQVLRPQSTVGVCISILFSFFTVAVLTCLRGKTQSLLIKLQFALSVMIMNAVMIAGLQGGLSKIPCRVVTILQLYFAVASFAWLTKDITYIALCISCQLPSQQFKVVCLITWGVPVPIVGIALIVGLVDSGKIGFKAYDCWPSDHLVWLLIIPCISLIVASVISIVKAIKNAKKRFKENPPPISIREKAIRYNLTTNATLLTLNTFVWIFSTIVFCYPDNESVQLILGFSNAAQGLFLFFLLCVFNSKEKRIYNIREAKIPVRSPLSKIDETSEDHLNSLSSVHSLENSNHRDSSSCNKAKNADGDILLSSNITENTLGSDSICQPDEDPPSTEMVVIPNAHTACRHGPTVAREINNFEDFINASMATCAVKPLWDRADENEDNDSAAKQNQYRTPTKKDSLLDTRQAPRLSSTDSMSGLSSNSSTSFSTMNELEILFNNPDLMSVGYPKKTRTAIDQDIARTKKHDISSLPSTPKQHLIQIESNDNVNNTNQNAEQRESGLQNNDLYVIDEIEPSQRHIINIQCAEKNKESRKNTKNEIKVQMLKPKKEMYDSIPFDERTF